MRTKLAFKNMLFGLILQGVLILSGFIIPRFFTELYGSSVNGLVNSISQFIAYINLVEAGISSSVILSLYKPLGKHDTLQVNRVLSATRRFYLRSGIAFGLLIGVFILLYPTVVQRELPDTTFVRTMVFILSISGLVDYFILGKYRVLLQADQHSYILSIAQIIGTVIMTAVSVFFMSHGLSALFVKGIATLIYILRSLAVVVYVHCHYPGLNFHESPDNTAVSQRWYVLIHHIAGMITRNTDLVLINLFVKTNALVKVSIYSTYNLVAVGLNGIMDSFANGLTSGFGQLIVNKDTQALKKSFSEFEYAYYIFIFFVYTLMALLLYPFMSLYTASYHDAELYLSWIYVALFTLSGILQGIRQPSLIVICAAGHFKETVGRACLEFAVNLSFSLFLVSQYDIAGVLIGTCAAFLYRSADSILYNRKHFIPGSLRMTVRRLLRNTAVSACILVMGFLLLPSKVSLFLWIIEACLLGTLALLMFVGTNYIFEKETFMCFSFRLRSLFSSKEK